MPVQVFYNFLWRIPSACVVYSDSNSYTALQQIINARNKPLKTAARNALELIILFTHSIDRKLYALCTPFVSRRIDQI